MDYAKLTPQPKGVSDPELLKPGERKALQEYYDVGDPGRRYTTELESLLKKLNPSSTDPKKLWLTCPCAKGAAKVPAAWPILFSRWTPAGDIKLYALESGDRPHHSDDCTFNYIDIGRGHLPLARQYKHPHAPGSLTGLLLLKAPRFGESQADKEERIDAPGKTTGGRRLTTLARILFTLLVKGDANYMDPAVIKTVNSKYAVNSSSVLRPRQAAWVGAITRIKDFASSVLLEPGYTYTLDGALFFDLADLRSGDVLRALQTISVPGKIPTAYLITPAAHVAGNEIWLDRYADPTVDTPDLVADNSITRLSIRGNIIQGPYLVIIRLALELENGVETVRIASGYAHPTFDFGIQLPVDSNAERHTVKLMCKSIAEVATELPVPVRIGKPLFSVGRNPYRPDFTLETIYGNVKFVVESLGFDDDDYLRFKAEMLATLPLAVSHHNYQTGATARAADAKFIERIKNGLQGRAIT